MSDAAEIDAAELPPPQETSDAAAAGCDDSGLIAYATLLAIHRIAVDPGQLRHGLGHSRAIDADDLKRLAKRQEDVRARSMRASYARRAFSTKT